MPTQPQFMDTQQLSQSMNGSSQHVAHSFGGLPPQLHPTGVHRAQATLGSIQGLSGIPGLLNMQEVEPHALHQPRQQSCQHTSQHSQPVVVPFINLLSSVPMQQLQLPVEPVQASKSAYQYQGLLSQLTGAGKEFNHASTGEQPFLPPTSGTAFEPTEFLLYNRSAETAPAGQLGAWGSSNGLSYRLEGAVGDAAYSGRALQHEVAPYNCQHPSSHDMGTSRSQTAAVAPHCNAPLLDPFSTQQPLQVGNSSILPNGTLHLPSNGNHTQHPAMAHSIRQQGMSMTDTLQQQQQRQQFWMELDSSGPHQAAGKVSSGLGFNAAALPPPPPSSHGLPPEVDLLQPPGLDGLLPPPLPLSTGLVPAAADSPGTAPGDAGTRARPAPAHLQNTLGPAHPPSSLQHHQNHNHTPHQHHRHHSHYADLHQQHNINGIPLNHDIQQASAGTTAAECPHSRQGALRGGQHHDRGSFNGTVSTTTAHPGAPVAAATPPPTAVPLPASIPSAARASSTGTTLAVSGSSNEHNSTTPSLAVAAGGSRGRCPAGSTPPAPSSATTAAAAAAAVVCQNGIARGRLGKELERLGVVPVDTKRTRTRLRHRLADMEAAVAAKLEALSALEAERSALQQRLALLEACVACRETQIASYHALVPEAVNVSGGGQPRAAGTQQLPAAQLGEPGLEVRVETSGVSGPTARASVEGRPRGSNSRPGSSTSEDEASVATAAPPPLPAEAAEVLTAVFGSVQDALRVQPPQLLRTFQTLTLRCMSYAQSVLGGPKNSETASSDLESPVPRGGAASGAAREAHASATGVSEAQPVEVKAETVLPAAGQPAATAPSSPEAEAAKRRAVAAATELQVVHPAGVSGPRLRKRSGSPSLELRCDDTVTVAATGAGDTRVLRQLMSSSTHLASTAVNAASKRPRRKGPAAAAAGSPALGSDENPTPFSSHALAIEVPTPAVQSAAGQGAARMEAADHVAAHAGDHQPMRQLAQFVAAVEILARVHSPAVLGVLGRASLPPGGGPSVQPQHWRKVLTQLGLSSSRLQLLACADAHIVQPLLAHQPQAVAAISAGLAQLVEFEGGLGAKGCFGVQRAGLMVAKGSLRDTVVRHVQDHDSKAALLLGLLLGHVLDKEQAGLLLLASFPFFPDPLAIAAEAAGVLESSRASVAGGEGDVDNTDAAGAAAAGDNGDEDGAEPAEHVEVKKEVSAGGGGQRASRSSGRGEGGSGQATPQRRSTRSTRSKKAIIETSDSPSVPDHTGSADTNENSSEATD